MKYTPTYALMTVLVVAGFGSAQEKLPPNTKLLSLEAHPPTILLKTPFDYSQVLLTGKLDNGDQLDVTRMATVKPPAVVKVTPGGQVRPVADGAGAIEFTLGGQTVRVAVTVSGQKEKFQANFVRDVMPTMSKLGCNAGTCHGAQAGKNGFKLSLRGYDPLFDHEALTDELAGRRFNRAAPDVSLMLLKPAGAVPHVGGVLMQPGDPYYELLRNWIANGAVLDLTAPRVSGIEVFPKAPVVPLPGMRQQMQVIARYSDGSTRDVTAEAFIESSNTEVAKVDKNGLVTTERRGEAAMLARYEGNYAAASLIVMGDRSGFTWQPVPTNNFIDELVYEKLQAVKVLPSGLCSDGDFIRRVTLDLTGLPPEPDAVRAFVLDPRPTKEKREQLVDKLVGSPDYVEHWTNKWADLLQVNRKFLGEQGASALRGWIRQAIADNMPYDKFAYTILTASGSTVVNPPAAYFKVLRDAPSAMENTTQLFLAVRFNCNKCHDHPFERWTQDQYYHLAAYFAQVSRKEDPAYKGQKVGGSAVEGAQPLVEIIDDVKAGEVKHERTGKVTPPKFPYEHPDLLPETASRREQVARWVTSKENQYFAKSYVNRLWSYLLGVGLIEPIDDIRAGNPASNPKLLDRLTSEFVQSGFDAQHMMRLICKSRVYQHDLATNQWNADDEVNYSHALARRLPAEVLYDAIHRVTGSVSKLPGLPAGSRAAQLLDANVELPGGFLTLFGKPPRESACECERSGGMMLGPILNLVNGPVVGDALKDPNNRIAKLLATQKDDGKVVEEIFLAVLARLPNEAEKTAGLKALAGHRDEYAALLAEHEKRAAALASHEATLPARQEAWEKSVANQAVTWNTLEPSDLKSKIGAKLEKQDDGSILATGLLSGPELYTIVAPTKDTGITGLRLEVLADKSLSGGGPGRAQNGNFVLHELKVTATGPEADAKPKPLALVNASATFSQAGFAIGGAVDGNLATGWAISPEFNKNHAAVFQLKEPLNLPAGTKLTFTLDQRYQDKQHNIGKFRLSTTTAKSPALTVLPEAVTAALAVPPDMRTDAQKTTLRQHYLTLDGEYTRLRQALAEFGHPGDPRSIGAQDLMWALLNSPAFLFNH